MNRFLYILLASMILVPSIFAQVKVGADQLEKGWLGITVLSSTRDDVEKKLGKPAKEEYGDIWYETEDARFSFLYSNGPCVSPDTLTGGFNIKAGTVLQYDVQLKKVITIGELGIDVNAYDRIEDPEVLSFADYYYKGTTDFWIQVLKMSEPRKEIVRTIYYLRTPQQVEKFRCRKKQ